MRGSTLCEMPPACPVQASPAHAGIDPQHQRHAQAPGGFPRACGDRPKTATVMSRDPQLPPRMRGSTFDYSIIGMNNGASPAHAGIDPGRREEQARVGGFPRACGDRPILKSRQIGATWLPPRMRGSTRGDLTRKRRIRASPAHAGIDLQFAKDQGWDMRFPRACGDRPVAVAAPRARGKLPPRMRGSTYSIRRSHVPVGASPAHAGIDLIFGEAQCGPDGFPRACGDRPLAGAKA